MVATTAIPRTDVRECVRQAMDAIFEEPDESVVDSAPGVNTDRNTAGGLIW